MPNPLALGGPNSKYNLPGASPAGFLAGFWHGIICPLTLAVSFVNPEVRIYEVNNNGVWYDFGFFIGISGAFSGGVAGTDVSSGAGK